MTTFKIQTLSLMIERILDLYRRYKFRKYGWIGNFENWGAAKNKCAGYDEEQILSQVLQSSLKVKNGESAWERDGLNFDQIYYSWPLLSHLMLIAAKNNGNLSLIDFGGSLGTTYFQNRQFLQKLSKVTWSIIEQAHFVKAGNEQIAFEALDFFETIDLAFKKHKNYDAILINCVIPYLENPYEILYDVKSFSFKTIIIENTYYHMEAEDRICVQTVDPMFYGSVSSYPSRFLDYEKVKNIFLDKYEVFHEYDTGVVLYLDNKTIKYRSLILNFKENKV
jgi:putative methyltransferase (TIGR04325 family)